MRSGEVIRLLPHGTAIVWDTASKTAFPYYGRQKLAVGESVQFDTNKADTVIVDLYKSDKR